MVLGDDGNVLGEGVRNQGTRAFGIFRVGVCDKRDEARDKEAGDSLVGYSGLGLKEERADAVGRNFGSLRSY